MSAENPWVARAEAVAHAVLARHADDVDSQGRWPAERPAELGGAGAAPAAFTAVTRALAEQCASTAMIYLMHVCATQVMVRASSFPLREPVLREVAAGRHLATLAVSEKGSRSHFWAPVS